MSTKTKTRTHAAVSTGKSPTKVTKVTKKVTTKKPTTIVINNRELFSYLLKTDYETYILYENFNPDWSKLKLAYMRAALKSFQEELNKSGKNTQYIDYKDISTLPTTNVDKPNKNTYIFTRDELKVYNTQQREKINKLIQFKKDYKKKYGKAYVNKRGESKEDNVVENFSGFYIWVRREKNIFLDASGKYIGGKLMHYSDADVDENAVLPQVYPKFSSKEVRKEAISYVNDNFPDSSGECEQLLKEAAHPVTRREVRKVLKNFIEDKLDNYGEYYNYIFDQKETPFGFSSALSIPLSVGLLEPMKLIRKIEDADTTSYSYNANNVINREIFIREIIKREYYKYLDYFYSETKIRSARYSVTADTTYDIQIVDYSISNIVKYGYIPEKVKLYVVVNFFNIMGIDYKSLLNIFDNYLIEDSHIFYLIDEMYLSTKFSKGPCVTDGNYLTKHSDYLPTNKKKGWDNNWTTLLYGYLLENREVLIDSDIGYRYKFLDKKKASDNKVYMKYYDDFHKDIEEVESSEGESGETESESEATESEEESE